ncbi:MAG: DinB family protein [Candidatus Acidiferrales bacterium]
MSEPSFISPTALLAHWQGHRKLTRRVIEAFPDGKLFTFSVGGMRPFGDMAMELLTMAVPTVNGVLSNDWQMASRGPLAKPELLGRWDESTAQLNTLWPQIPAARFAEKVTAFGQWPGIVHDVILYVIDNEIHHRGQGYVYLRALGVEPPAFYER